MEGLIARIAVGVFGLITVALLLLAIFNDHGMLAIHQNNLKLEQIKAENDALIKENEQIRKDIRDLRYNPAAIEKKAREELKLVKPGEIIIVTPSAPAKQ
jgi:cell division protein FtsB